MNFPCPASTIKMIAVSGLIQKLERLNRNPLEKPMTMPLRCLLLSETRWKTAQKTIIITVNTPIRKTMSDEARDFRTTSISMSSSLNPSKSDPDDHEQYAGVFGQVEFFVHQLRLSRAPARSVPRP